MCVYVSKKNPPKKVAHTQKKQKIFFHQQSAKTRTKTNTKNEKLSLSFVFEEIAPPRKLESKEQRDCDRRAVDFSPNPLPPVLENLKTN